MDVVYFGEVGCSHCDTFVEKTVPAVEAEHGEFRLHVPPTMDGSTDSAPPVRSDGVLPLLPVLLAGLADGINPCAFATVVFLLSLLALVGRTRREVLITGLVFAATVFATYFAIGFGLLSVLREALNFTLLRFWLRVVVSAGTAVLAVLSIRDGILIARGKRSEAVLALS